MGSAVEARPERRAATRYRVPARAQLYWPDAPPVRVSIADISAHGCSVLGERLPAVGSRVFLSLEMPGLPNVRLPATTVRAAIDGSGPVVAIRFDVPPASARGLDKLLADCSSEHECSGHVLIVDGDERSRERVAESLRARGMRVLAVGTSTDAATYARNVSVDVVLARADAQGLDALAWLAAEAPNALRIAYGRSDAVEHAMALGCAQAVADDPTSAKCLGSLLGDRIRRLIRA